MAANPRSTSDIEAKTEHSLVEMASNTGPLKTEAILENGDYSGAVKKTDPKEIQLVRKLDYRIMPTLWAMYFLNYVCQTVSSYNKMR